MVENARSKVGFSLGGGAGAGAGAKAKAKANANANARALGARTAGDDELDENSGRGIEREFITTVANGEIEPAQGARKAEANAAKVIPCLADTWKGAAESTIATEAETETDTAALSNGRKRFVPSAAAELKEELERNQSGNTEDRFVKEEIPDTKGESDITYGLQMRGAPAAAKKSEKFSVPLRDMEEAKLKEDLPDLPVESSLEAYEAMPIEDFGKAMLYGMGWKEGQPAGRNAKKEVLPTEIVPWKNRMGLGASEVAVEEIEATRKDKKGSSSKQKKRARPGDFTEQKEKAKEVAEAAAKGPTRRLGGTQTESFLSKGKPRVGAYAIISEGIHKGLRGKIVEVSDNDVATVRLNNDERVRIKIGWLSDPNSYKRGTDPRPASSTKDEGSRSKSDSGPTWLAPSIRVRVISKTFENGRYYLKKGYIVDVPMPSHADVVIRDSDDSEGGKLIKKMPKRNLETVLPKPGGRILILRGKHRGERGKLLEKNNREGLAQVQLQESFKIVTKNMDDVAEYIGAMDDLD